MDLEALRRFEEAVRRDGRYAPEAFEFLHRGLEHTTRAIYGEESGDKPRHVTGQQLCEGLRELALQQWGPLAKTVLARWHIHNTRDFGEMVFLLVRLRMMGRQKSDCLDDFDKVYDFDEAFGSYEISFDEDVD